MPPQFFKAIEEPFRGRTRNRIHRTRFQKTGRYMPHQGKQEMARRVRQMEALRTAAAMRQLSAMREITDPYYLSQIEGTNK